MHTVVTFNIELLWTFAARESCPPLKVHPLSSSLLSSESDDNDDETVPTDGIIDLHHDHIKRNTKLVRIDAWESRLLNGISLTLFRRWTITLHVYKWQLIHSICLDSDIYSGRQSPKHLDRDRTMSIDFSLRCNWSILYLALDHPVIVSLSLVPLCILKCVSLVHWMDCTWTSRVLFLFSFWRIIFS